MKKILALTGIRSDYDLMVGLFRLLRDDPEVEFKLLVSGAHLSDTYGHSVDLIERDGFDILHTVETLIDSNSSASRLKTGSILLQNSIDVVARYQPDIILYAGDREDVIMGALLGGYLEIPTVHFYGGDHVQDGHIDNPVRHATSKLSTLHLVCIEEHRQRLLRLGEAPERIYTVGSISLDRFVDHRPIPKAQLLQQFGLGADFNDFAMLIFHPVAEEKAVSHNIFTRIMETLKSRHIPTFVSAPNTDPGNREILKVIDRFRADPGFCFYKNLDRDTFLSLYKQCRFLIGNSSSGIYESASVPIPVVNVGLRQVGRRANANVIFCGTAASEIETALDEALSARFGDKIAGIQNLYGDGHSAERAYQLLKNLDLRALVYKKEDPLELPVSTDTLQQQSDSTPH